MVLSYFGVVMVVRGGVYKGGSPGCESFIYSASTSTNRSIRRVEGSKR